MATNERMTTELAERRYVYEYSRATKIIGSGRMLRGLTLVAALLGLLSLRVLGLLALIGTPILCVSLYFLGVAVAAQGHILRATLDSAVHSSPFLDDETKAEVIWRSLAGHRRSSASTIDAAGPSATDGRSGSTDDARPTQPRSASI